MNTDLIEATLAWVNEIRADRQIGEPLTELPKGSCSGYGCPIANALCIDRETDYAGTVDVRFGAVRLIYPPAVSAFVRAYDRKEFPELLS